MIAVGKDLAGTPHVQVRRGLAGRPVLHTGARSVALPCMLLVRPAASPSGCLPLAPLRSGSQTFELAC